MAAADNSTLVGWRSKPPSDRYTYDIISLCVSTLIICAWSAVHIDVPTRRTFKSTHGTRILWCLIGVFMPELLLTSAVGQFLNARRISAYAYKRLGFERPVPWWRQWYSWIVSLRTRRKQESATGPNNRVEEATQETAVMLTESASAHSKVERKHAWTSTHSFYALMGGFPEVDPDSLTLTMDENFNTSVIENAPDVSIDDIMDRSKSGPLSKAVLCAQIVFFCANCAARINQQLPLSLLEITTIAHALCALGAYAFWWNKPQDVGGEAPLRDETDNMNYLMNPVLGHYVSDDAPIQVPFNSFVLIVTAMIAALYGCPHLLGLHIHFPTPAEHTIWLLSTILVISCPILAVLTPWTLLLFAWVDRIIFQKIVLPGVWSCFFGFLLIYAIASAFLVCESVRQVFALPDAAFRQPQWTQYIPHFS